MMLKIIGFAATIEVEIKMSFEKHIHLMWDEQR